MIHNVKPSTFYQKDEPIPLKVIGTPSISPGLEKSFAIIKFTPLSLRKIARDYNSQEEIKTTNDPLSKKGDVIDTSLHPKINSSSKREKDPKTESSKNHDEVDLKKKLSKSKTPDQTVPPKSHHLISLSLLENFEVPLLMKTCFRIYQLSRKTLPISRPLVKK